MTVINKTIKEWIVIHNLFKDHYKKNSENLFELKTFYDSQYCGLPFLKIFAMAKNLAIAIDLCEDNKTLILETEKLIEKFLQQISSEEYSKYKESTNAKTPPTQ